MNLNLAPVILPPLFFSPTTQYYICSHKRKASHSDGSHFYFTVASHLFKLDNLGRKLTEKLKSEPRDQKAMELAPLRPLDDFILSGARFQIPDVQNEDRWFNRIVHNLLYYQTNYFLASVIIFLLVSFAHPREMAAGIVAISVILAGFLYAQRQQAGLARFKRQHPVMTSVGVFASGYFVIYQMGYIVVFLLGVVLPLAFVILHASFRLRNVRNKLANATEALGLAKKSPMALFLQELGIEPDLKYA